MQVKTILLAGALSVVPGLLHAQFDFRVAGRNVQVHSFASQGFAYSNTNNYLSMKTSEGSPFTDFGASISTQLTDKFRVGVQLYDRNVGNLGNWKPSLDWAFADYRFKDWFGIRAGRVKTVLGLYNDTQDMPFLHTWALLPTAVYPMDARSDTIAHDGVDIYGNISLKKLGDLSYTVWGGHRPFNRDSGFVYSVETSSVLNGKYITTSTKKIDYYGGPARGIDLHWNTPLKGLLVGASYMNIAGVNVRGSYRDTNIKYTNYFDYDTTQALYVHYTAGKFTFDSEYRKEPRRNHWINPLGQMSLSNKNSREGYVSAAYRVSKRLELGSYHSRFISSWTANHGDPANHVFDTAVTARVDLHNHLDLKLEQHFIDGSMINADFSRGFFAAPNIVNGLKPDMKMFVARLSFHM